MEILQLVRVRGARWRIADLRAYGSCQLVTLSGAEPRTSGMTRRVLAPFDRIDPLPRRDRPVVVGPRRWRRACRSLLAANTPPGSLRSARRAKIDLLPHQLEPAMAVLRGVSCRLLLADDVGLGKTIQAGLVVAELLARALAERALVLAPAGVRDQWVDELSGRFGIAATIADTRSLRETAARLPASVNPWTTLPIAVASLDYVKRSEVLPAVSACRWDVIVVDEAHGAAADTDRRQAVRLLAAQSPHVLLLTATPHNGDTAAFDALCGIGAIDSSGAVDGDRLLVFRRSRQDVRGDAVRRTHTLLVRQTPWEHRMHRALIDYQRAAAAEHGERALVLSVLDKRSCSSAWSLMQSTSRRLEAIAAAADGRPVQLGLPLDDGQGEFSVEDQPPSWPADLGLADAALEQRLLTTLLEAARTAAECGESKILLLRRFLRRVSEPVIVFTEYRDTAFHVRDVLGARSVLHGGLSREQRQELTARFCRGADSILIATDAAGQGLNLHRACRIVVNLELPWNPMRLEQRIGRVDRIGQLRRVHAFHLVAAGTGEQHLLARLRARIERARDAIDGPDPIDSGVRSPGGAPSTASRIMTIDSATQAAHEAVRIAAARSLDDGSDADRPSVGGPWILRARRWKLRAALRGRSLLLSLMETEDGAGRAAESELVPVALRFVDLKGANAVVPDWIVDRWQQTVAAVVRPFWTTRLARERAIAADAERHRTPLFQASLFDRRRERARAQELAEQADAAHDAAERLAALERRAALSAPVVRPLLIVLP